MHDNLLVNFYAEPIKNAAEKQIEMVIGESFKQAFKLMLEEMKKIDENCECLDTLTHSGHILVFVQLREAIKALHNK